MIFRKTKIKDVVICEPEIYGDERGYFIESFNKQEFEKNIGEKISFCQDNESKSTYGVLRGLHFQKPPHTQSKLVRVIEGKVLDVVVDLRKKSNTFGEHIAVVLDDEFKRQLFVPKGFAHGFVVLSETAVFSYKVDNYYNASSEDGVIFNDTSLNIDWNLPFKDIKLSEKDKINNKFIDAYKF